MFDDETPWIDEQTHSRIQVIIKMAEMEQDSDFRQGATYYNELVEIRRRLTDANTAVRVYLDKRKKHV
jgi:hypothetical protein